MATINTLLEMSTYMYWSNLKFIATHIHFSENVMSKTHEGL